MWWLFDAYVKVADSGIVVGAGVAVAGADDYVVAI
jgi:hypothetical protein